MSNLRLLSGLRNLSSSTLGRVRINFRQELVRRCSTQPDTGDEENLSSIARVAREYAESYGPIKTNRVVESKDPKDRTVPIPVEVSMRYLKSEAYKTTYGDNLVWTLYRRNFKGHHPPMRTRYTCIRKGFVKTNNPCPICRDEYLVLHYKNVDLLKQFINPYNGSVLPVVKTHICMKQYDLLLQVLTQAKDEGTFVHDVVFRVYDYDKYKPKKTKSN